MSTALPFLTSPALAGVHHAFFTRRGGVSTGIYASLNTGPGSKDAPDAVAENRARCARALGVRPDRLLSLYQIHSARAVLAEEPWARANAPEADAVVTRERGLALGILAADCAPVLFADSHARVIAAAHAGWRGALSGVLEAAIALMIDQGAKRERIVAAVGPCIGAQSYEVGPEFEARFRAEDANASRFFTPAARPAHFQFDLPRYVASRLAAQEIAAVDTVAHCVYQNEADFFSYRRGTHRGEADYGRNLSAIVLP